MHNYRTRHIEKRLLAYEKYFKVIVVAGARQVGKSTLLSRLLPGVRTFVFDPVQDVYGAGRDPDLFLDTYPPPLILDEVQFVPALLPALKRRVDMLDYPGQYYLAGSQNLAALCSGSGILGGRAALLHLAPLTFYEIFGQPEMGWLQTYLREPESLVDRVTGLLQTPPLITLIWRGGLPGLLDLPDELVPDYLRTCLQICVERDMRLMEIGRAHV